MVLAAVLAPAVVVFAAAGDVRPFAARETAKPVINDIAPCCLEIVTATPNMSHRAVGMGFTDGRMAAASRYHTRSRFLPVGVAPEHQVARRRTDRAVARVRGATPIARVDDTKVRERSESAGDDRARIVPRTVVSDDDFEVWSIDLSGERVELRSDHRAGVTCRDDHRHALRHGAPAMVSSTTHPT